MSLVKIRAALEIALDNMSPALSTAWQNNEFDPVNGTPYQCCHLMIAEPSNDEFGSNWQEEGYLQVDLCYPLLGGMNAIDARVELLRTTFARGTSLVNSGTTVTIYRTPFPKPGYTDGDRFITPVIIRFYANIGL